MFRVIFVKLEDYLAFWPFPCSKRKTIATNGGSRLLFCQLCLALKLKKDNPSRFFSLSILVKSESGAKRLPKRIWLSTGKNERFSLI
jgi:hypothetical protein